ncbi:hypothetical protein FN846DRAFT_678112 [Sphaerosporella brunnea]|uniref:Uncharacterized protein n=1 Tax=Sphaerosporella brunnea TaxID=1250544 RepID=A0A5J5FAW5_9PEZI|nr:hypothetical protein FN846DRAFT_678112 [Sphaerosporella brunnea]
MIAPSTPPRRVNRPRTPTAPRHATDFEEYTPPRRSLRLKDLKSSPTVTIGTLSPPPSSPLAAQTPSPKQRRKVRKATFVLDEDQDIGAGKGKGKKETGERTKSGATTASSSGIGLPTPAKTPSRKRKLAPEQVASSAQALFPPTQVSSSRSAAKGGLFGVRKPRETASVGGSASALATPRRRTHAASTLRLESEESSLEIFTDSVDRRPKLDDDPENPFITRPGDETKSAKRTRQQRADKTRNRIGDDADREDGMVYMFRGKKVFKRFAHLPDHHDRAASEDQDDEEAGLNPTKIKPRFLFQSASSKLSKTEEAPEDNELAEEDEVDEEAETDIDVKERPESRSSSIVITHKSNKKSTGKRPAVSRMTPDSEDDVQPLPKLSSFKARLAAASGAASKKALSGSKALFDEVAPPKKGVKRNLDIGLDTPPSTRKRTRRALY